MTDSRRKFIILASLLVAVVLGVIFVQRFIAWNRLQECFASGRRDCAPITPQS